MTVSNIISIIKNAFNFTRGTAPKIPAPVMAIGAISREGMSTIQATTNIAAKLAEHGIPTEPAEDGSENETMVLVIAIVEEILRSIREDANIQVAFKPGDITVMTTGANGGGPMVSQGININFPQGTAVIQ